VSSAITFFSGKPMPAVIDRSLWYRRWLPGSSLLSSLRSDQPIS
jgi:hypothetical protein